NTLFVARRFLEVDAELFQDCFEPGGRDAVEDHHLVLRGHQAACQTHDQSAHTRQPPADHKASPLIRSIVCKAQVFCQWETKKPAPRKGQARTALGGERSSLPYRPLYQ